MIVKVTKAKVDFYEVDEVNGKVDLVKKSEVLSGVRANEKAVAKYFAKAGRVVCVESVEKLEEKYNISDEKFFEIAEKVEK